MSGPWLTWNVRGLGGSTKREAVKKSVMQLKPELLLIQETKLNEQQQRTITLWTQSFNMQHVESYSVGIAGGLMCLWRESSLQVLTAAVETWFILLTVKLPNLNQSFLVGNVYGPHSEADRRLCFEALKNRVMRYGGLVSLGGDFNAVLLGSERSSGGVLHVGDLSCQQFVQDNNLVELPLNNGDFTWFSSRNEGLWSRLDRWLVSDEKLFGP
ncbi:uncharacterized protein LOC130747394 [Lotus japonicus]|uniref:uncharacterized protein LOC130747394 n=1 Tax=Lotus japonicus TaxID=34305 RepID=UPI002585BDA1|nr:uncharacterized protein LOC130747394 [Lotus japonicus]